MGRILPIDNVGAEVDNLILARSEELYRLAVRATKDMIWDLDLITNELKWNDEVYSTLGYRPDQVEPTLDWWMEKLHPDDRDRVVAIFDAVIVAGEEQFTCEYRFSRADGSYAWIYDRGFIVRDADGVAVRGVGAMQDQTARKTSEEALMKSEWLSRSIIEANPDCVSVLDLDGRVLFANNAVVRSYGLDSDKPLVGRRWGCRLDSKSQHDITAALSRVALGQTQRITFKLPSRDGESRWYDSVISPIRDTDGTLIRYVVMSRDITDHKETESRIRWVANHDSLTRLPNRLLFQQRLEEFILEAAIKEDRFALLVIDVDEFKRVNDTLGHDVGDKLLCAVADRLRCTIRDDDFVARLGGDEFAVLLRRANNPTEVMAACQKVITALREPWIYANRALDCRASIGASLYGIHGVESSELLKAADVALYVAKKQGRGRTALFEQQMRSSFDEHSRMIAVGRQALCDRTLVPHYQPQIELRTGRVIGFEALLRINHPTKGLLEPRHVAAALEDVEVAADIGEAIADLVLQDVRRWLDDKVHFGHVSINTSAADFHRGNFATRLLQRMKNYGVPPQKVQIEVTETVFLGRGAEYVGDSLKRLSRAGVRIALDDFGTGYASLSHLQKFPIDVLKIDKSFVKKMADNPSDKAIVKAVLLLGKSLNLDVIAEGIETQGQDAQLRCAGCRFGQGYLYGRPMPAAQVLKEMLRVRDAA